MSMTASTGRARGRARNAGGSARQAADSPWVKVAARVGLVAKGVSYVLIGALALRVAFGVGGQTEDRQGILRQLADESFGTVALVLLALGFGCYALWRFISAAFEGDPTDKGDLAGKGEHVISGVIYAISAYAAVSLLTGSGSGGGNEDQETARVLEWPGGRFIVGAVGLGLIGYGLWNAYKGQSEKFRKHLREHEMQHNVAPWAIRAGVVGYIARGVVFVIVGFFLGKAAVEYDPQEAVGIDGALSKLADQTYGTWLLGLTAAGLVAYGLYCFVQARYRRV
jgi:hypothetical protein